MSSVRDDFKHFLKGAGQSITKPRLAVFDALIGQEPLAMRDLVHKVKSVDRASIYRTVDLFERLGIAQRLNTGWKYKLELTDKFAAHHHHLTCVNCGRTIAMNETELERTIEKLTAAHGFVPSSHQIEIQGLCSDCAAKRHTN
jgi:Fur family transcriptional regulator, ferric uptake regulator